MVIHIVYIHIYIYILYIYIYIEREMSYIEQSRSCITSCMLHISNIVEDIRYSM